MTIAAQASAATVQNMRREIADGAESLSAQGLGRSGAMEVLRYRAAEDAIRSFAEQTINGVIGLVEIVFYGQIPPDSVDWLQDQLTTRIRSFAASIGRGLGESRHQEEVVNRAAIAALHDLSIRLAPIRIRVEQGIAMDGRWRSARNDPALVRPSQHQADEYIPCGITRRSCGPDANLRAADWADSSRSASTG